MPNMYPVELTQLESLYLSDCISMFMQGPPDGLPGQGAPYPMLLLKIGGAILETEEQKAPATAHLSLSELWVIREVTKSSAVVGSERVGLNLLMKVYTGISALSAESDMQSLVSVFGEVVDDEPGKSEYAAQLERIRSSYEHESGGAEDENTSNHQSDKSDKDRPDHDAANAA